ncbi:MAG: hypothetical protein Ct9H300mP21_05930 [Pseudomonadota bacterium]|nr:MAG: hypothetical protein Ct9H300mP21_05930 [Pseudomonadota bacterium]
MDKSWQIENIEVVQDVPAGEEQQNRPSEVHRFTKGVPYITRKVPFFEVLDEEGLSLIENNAEKYFAGNWC